MTRREPVQKRSRERVEQILFAAADQLAKGGTTDDLTTTSVSKRSGIPVATVYRYFTDRMAIIAALIDRELEEVDVAVAEHIQQLETVSIASLFEATMMAHLRHFQSRKRAIILWFGARKSNAVLDRVDRRYEDLAQWLHEATLRTGMLRPETPDYGTETMVWLSDRTFEVIFRKERSPQVQEAMMLEFIGMMCDYINRKYATTAGIEGVPREEFVKQAGLFHADHYATPLLERGDK